MKKVEFHVLFKIQQTYQFSGFQDWQDYSISIGLHNDESKWDN
jgi:hypothetical protein